MALQNIGRYAVKEQLAVGGMATVYRAYDSRFDREVALKVLPREFVHDPTFRARFEREAKAIAALEHPAIVPVYDFGEEQGQPYLVMRYMAGGSLTERIQRGPLSVAEAARIFANLAPALDESHRRGIIHRDLKPGNILFDTFGNAYLSDFGIVKMTEATIQLTGTGMVGTPAYMAPEMAEPGGLSAMVDIYALGVTLFQMLTGRLPYEADTPMGVLMAHMSKPIPDVRELRQDLPADVQAVVRRTLAKDPMERYPSAGEMVAALQAVAARTAAPDALTAEVGEDPAGTEPLSARAVQEAVEALPKTEQDVPVAATYPPTVQDWSPPPLHPPVAGRRPPDAGVHPPAIRDMRPQVPIPQPGAFQYLPRPPFVARWWRLGLSLVTILLAPLVMLVGRAVVGAILLPLSGIPLGIIGIEHLVRKRWMHALGFLGPPLGVLVGGVILIMYTLNIISSSGPMVFLLSFAALSAIIAIFWAMIDGMAYQDFAAGEGPFKHWWPTWLVLLTVPMAAAATFFLFELYDEVLSAVSLFVMSLPLLGFGITHLIKGRWGRGVLALGPGIGFALLGLLWVPLSDSGDDLAVAILISLMLFAGTGALAVAFFSIVDGVVYRALEEKEPFSFRRWWRVGVGLLAVPWVALVSGVTLPLLGEEYLFAMGLGITALLPIVLSLSHLFKGRWGRAMVYALVTLAWLILGGLTWIYVDSYDDFFAVLWVIFLGLTPLVTYVSLILAYSDGARNRFASR